MVGSAIDIGFAYFSHGTVALLINSLSKICKIISYINYIKSVCLVSLVAKWPCKLLCILLTIVLLLLLSTYPLLRVAVEGSDNPVSLEKPCQASLPPDQQGRHSLGRQPEVQYVA